MNLSLMQALNEDRLEDFIQQQEAVGVSPVGEMDFNQLSQKLIKSEKGEKELHPPHQQQSYAR